MKKILLLVTIIGLFYLVGCQSQKDDIIHDITTNQLVDILNEDYQFVDIRTATEYEGGHIAEFNINIDYYQFSSNHALLDDLDKEKPIVIICNSGNRSNQAKSIFQDLGFKEIYNVTGGMVDWSGPTI